MYIHVRIFCPDATSCYNYRYYMYMYVHTELYIYVYMYCTMLMLYNAYVLLYYMKRLSDALTSNPVHVQYMHIGGLTVVMGGVD